MGNNISLACLMASSLFVTVYSAPTPRNEPLLVSQPDKQSNETLLHDVDSYPIPTINAILDKSTRLPAGFKYPDIYANPIIDQFKLGTPTLSQQATEVTDSEHIK